jgi:prepilin-type N-terminal cleavage/methylation domain-containing protein
MEAAAEARAGTVIRRAKQGPRDAAADQVYEHLLPLSRLATDMTSGEGTGMRTRENRRPEKRGFTLTELLVVIAIIALLAAMLFPVLRGVNNKRREAECIGHMHALITALKQYKENEGRYPDALYGINNEPRLFGPDYVRDEGTFTCPSSPVRTGSRNWVTATNAMAGAPTPYTLLESSSYDMGYRPMTPAGTRELHYTLKWTPGPPRPGDDPRQLARRDPPGETVVTWCLYHCDMDSQGNPAPNGQAIVAFLNGQVKKVPASQLVSWSGPVYPWQVRP